MTDVEGSFTEASAAGLRFEADWKRGKRPSIKAFADSVSAPARGMTELVLSCVEIQTRIKIGERARIESYCEMFPRFRDDRDAILELIEAECSARIAEGELVDWVGDYSRRFPIVASELDWPTIYRWGRRERPKEHPIREFPFHLGRFRLKGEIGRGSSAVVYAASELSERGRSTAAVKIPLGGIDSLDEDVRQLLRKSLYANRLNHPGIVRVLEAGVDAATGLPYVVFPYYRGVSLESQLRLGRTFSPEEAAEYVAVLSVIVAAAHDAGIVHRDLKPSNILPDDDGNPMVTDFGLATCAQGMTSVVDQEFPDPLGTPAYMAPEQLQGNSLVKPSMDIYALGVILYRLLTRHLPFEGSYGVIYQNVISSPPIPPSRYNQRVSNSLDRVCLKALEKAPAARFKTAHALAKALRAEASP